MRKISILLVLVLICGMLRAQNVTNTDAEQEGKTIHITYTLDKPAEIKVFVSTDGGRTYESNPLTAVSGDVGKNVTPGNKTIIWDVLSERDKFVTENGVFKVTASNGINLEMVYVEGGTFTMGCTDEQGSDCEGNECPAHQVTLSSYYIGKYEVTQAQWQAVMGDNPSDFKGDTRPVDNVSWDDVQEFIKKLNAMTGKQYRLPTEAEWEYAARGGTRSAGNKYSGSSNIDAVAWYGSNSGSGTHPVGQKVANELGIYDMSGNVWEWCSDWYSDWYGSYGSYSQTNPTGPNSGSSCVLRGGSWINYAVFCRVSNRNYEYPDYRYSYFGFRLVLVQ